MVRIPVLMIGNKQVVHHLTFDRIHISNRHVADTHRFENTSNGLWGNWENSGGLYTNESNLQKIKNITFDKNCES